MLGGGGVTRGTSSLAPSGLPGIILIILCRRARNEAIQNEAVFFGRNLVVLSSSQKIIIGSPPLRQLLFMY